MGSRRILAELMGEVILYGGLPVRRADVYDDARQRTGSHRAAAQFAFGLHTRLAPVGSVPLTREALARLP
jgi:hypothetical protein